MRLIDADALIKELDRKHYSMASRKQIYAQPTIDAVPVVRCKDCKWWEYVDTWDGHQVGSCEFVEMLTDPDGYCYRAERKDCLSIEKTIDKNNR